MKKKRLETIGDPGAVEYLSPHPPSHLALNREAPPLDWRTEEEDQRMREASGEVSSSDPLVSFLYWLARDRLTTGEVEGLLYRVPREAPRRVLFTNGWLARWAIDVAGRLRDTHEDGAGEGSAAGGEQSGPAPDSPVGRPVA